MAEGDNTSGGAVANPPAAPPPPPTQPTGVAQVTTYVSQLGDIGKWAVLSVAAVGAAAVTKLTLDRLGKGDLDDKYLKSAYLGLAAFVVGVVLLIASVIWQTRAGRVTLAYLLSHWPIAKRIRGMINGNTYLLGGQTSLSALRTRLNAIEKIKRPLKDDVLKERERLLNARDVTLLPTARAERARIVSGIATVAILVGALLATLGAATFALATNADLVQREDRLAKEERDRQKVVTGEFLPKTPSEVLVVVPKVRRTKLAPVLGRKCDLAKVNAILLYVGNPPKQAVPAGVGTASFHVVTERTAFCAIARLWLPPSWVIPRPEPQPLPPKPTKTEPATTTAAE